MTSNLGVYNLPKFKSRHTEWVESTSEVIVLGAEIAQTLNYKRVKLKQEVYATHSKTISKKNRSLDWLIGRWPPPKLPPEKKHFICATNGLVYVFGGASHAYNATWQTLRAACIKRPTWRRQNNHRITDSTEIRIKSISSHHWLKVKTCGLFPHSKNQISKSKQTINCIQTTILNRVNN